MALTEGKHVMFSYHHSSKNIVKVVYETLIAEKIQVRFNDKTMDSNIFDRYVLEYCNTLFEI